MPDTTMTRSEELNAELNKQKARRDELQRRQGELTRAITGAREEQGQLIAKGESADAVRSQLRELLDEAEGITRALEVIGREQARFERELRETQLKEHEAEFRVQAEKHRAALSRLAQEVRQFAEGRVQPIWTEIYETARRANAARDMADRLTGRPIVAGQEPYPLSALGEPSLRECVAWLADYSRGRLPEQQQAEMSRQLQEGYRRSKAARDGTSDVEAEEGTPAQGKEEVVAA